jgi:cytochrome bd-type quinol oxidase subunit 1
VVQTAWQVGERPGCRRLTRFFGTLMIINIAIGVATGHRVGYAINPGLASRAGHRHRGMPR